MSQYRQAILLFGFILPLLLAALIVGGMLYARAQLQATLAEKQESQVTVQKTKKEVLALEQEILQQRPHLTAWSAILEEETASSLTAAVNDLRGVLPEAEFQQTASNRSNAKGAFGSVSDQNSSELKLSFRATFRAMQYAFLDIESRLPQLQLQGLTINRVTNQPTLNIEASYTAWEK